MRAASTGREEINRISKFSRGGPCVVGEAAGMIDPGLRSPLPCLLKSLGAMLSALLLTVPLLVRPDLVLANTEIVNFLAPDVGQRIPQAVAWLVELVTPTL
jgi:hypothetical protein